MSQPRCMSRPATASWWRTRPAGVAAAHAAGMMPIGFIGGSHTNPTLGAQLTSAGARAVVADMRALKSTVVALRGF